MYRLLTKLKTKHIVSYKIDSENGKVYVNLNKGVKVFNGVEWNDLNENMKIPRVLLIIDKFIWISDISEMKSIIRDTKTGYKLKEVNFAIGFWKNKEYFITSKYMYPIVTIGIENRKRYIAKISREDFSISETYPLNIGLNRICLVIDDDTFVSRDKESIGVFGFDNKVRWMKRIARLGRSKEAFIHSDFQIYKNDLYFAISGTPDNKTFCIDVKTGKVKHKYKELIMFSRIEEDKLYNLFAGKLHILDLHSQKMHKIDLTSEFKKYNISTDAQYEVKSGLIYFKQSMGEVARIGIINPLLEKVVWTYEFPIECGQVGNIRVAGNRIYAHTQDQTLHIFDREE